MREYGVHGANSSESDALSWRVVVEAMKAAGKAWLQAMARDEKAKGTLCHWTACNLLVILALFICVALIHALPRHEPEPRRWKESSQGR